MQPTILCQLRIIRMIEAENVMQNWYGLTDFNSVLYIYLNINDVVRFIKLSFLKFSNLVATSVYTFS